MTAPSAEAAPPQFEAAPPQFEDPEATAPPAPPALEATAPPAVEPAFCVGCREAAVLRCDDCFDDEEGCLYLCAKEACFDKMHPFSRKHRKSLVAWDSKAKWVDRCCGTHGGNPLALWCGGCGALVCALCCSHGEHQGHATTLVTDAWQGMQEELRAAMGRLEEENAASRERLRRLAEEREALRAGGGAVGDARRVLHEAQALLRARVEALDGELDAAAGAWCAQAGESHARLARHTRSVQALVDEMRAACAEDEAEEAQRVVLACAALRAQREALGDAPPVSVRAIAVDVGPLRRAVADLCVRAAEAGGATATTGLCPACWSPLSEPSALCAGCAEAVRAFNEGGGTLATAGDRLRGNKAVVLAAVANPPFDFSVRRCPELAYASDHLKADKAVVMAAVAQEGDSLQHASDQLRADKGVVMAAVAQYGHSLQHASEELKADREVVMAAVTQSGRSLQHACPQLREDSKLVAAAVASDPSFLFGAGQQLQANETVVLAAVRADGNALQYASASCKADREIALSAVSQNGLALRYVGDQVKRSRLVVMAAVRQHGYALQYASDQWRATKDVVMAAVTQHGHSLQFASQRLKADKEVVTAAVTRHRTALQLADFQLREDYELQQIAKLYDFSFR